jgi:tetratricopeptide (TPR) repeat protein
MRNAWISLAAACALVIGVYAYTAHSGFLTSSSLNAANDCYNLLVQGFRGGQLILKKEVPPALAQLAGPYDGTANAPNGVLDLSYYKGKFYLYFGVTPAVVLFWPYVALTRHYLSQKDAALIFCLVGFLVSVGLLCALWRRYFAEVSVAVVVAGTLALGLATFTPFLLARCDVYEVPISCGYMLTMLALAAVWKALHEPEGRCRWLVAASLAYGLAVGGRPSLLFGAVILLVPVVQAWRERRRVLAALLAATAPIALIGLGLMLYNAMRFDNPFEFGLRYQLNGYWQLTRQLFSLRYLWFNFRVYFLEPARWGGRFPFVREIRIPTLPAGYGEVENAFGILTNIPLVWLALAVPLAWRGRPADVRSALRGFLAVITVLFGIGALTLCLFIAACTRYEVEFLPTLVLLAVIGILSLERALADRPVWRRAVRCSWSLLMGFSVAFNLLVSVARSAEARCNLGSVLFLQGRVPEAIAHYQQALQIDPYYAMAHNDLGSALMARGQVQDAIGHFEQAVRFEPDLHVAHYNLGIALVRLGRPQEAVQHYEQALRIKPDYATAHNSLGIALAQLGNVQEATEHWEQALRIKPDFAEAHNNLGVVLMRQGKLQEAIEHYEQALRVQPDSADAHCNLGMALVRLGKVQEAIGHYEQALRIKPDFVQAQNALARARAVQ